MDELWQRYKGFWTPVLWGVGVFLVGLIVVHMMTGDPDAGRTMGREVSIQGMAAGCLLAMGGDRALAVRRGEAAKAPPRSKVSLQALQARGVRTPRVMSPGRPLRSHALST